MEANLDVVLDRLRQGASEEVSLVMGEGVRDGRWCRGRGESEVAGYVTQALKQYLKEALRMLDTVKEG